MNFYDTHVHLDADWPVLLDRAVEAAVSRVVAVGGDDAMNEWAAVAARTRPAVVVAALGFDRDQAARRAPDSPALDMLMGELRRRLSECASVGGRVVAIGEIGLDYHYSPETAPLQRALFDRQLDLAAELGLPVIVHGREADADLVACLTRHRAQWKDAPDRIGVVHCYTGDAALARIITDLGFCLGFSGIVTFRNADMLRAVAAEVASASLLIETDTPFLAPVPQRGKRNEPAFVRHVAETLAMVRGATVADIADLTRANAERVFG
jgi:TatD DNase family protein